MKRQICQFLAFLVVLFGFAIDGSSANLAGAPTVFRAGTWSVRRAVDSMTDKMSCTGIYQSDFGAQLTESARCTSGCAEEFRA
jgi:hypothetical protein